MRAIKLGLCLVLLAVGGGWAAWLVTGYRPVIPVVTGDPAVGLEQARRHAGPLRGAPEGLRLGRLRVAVHDQGAV